MNGGETGGGKSTQYCPQVKVASQLQVYKSTGVTHVKYTERKCY